MKARPKRGKNEPKAKPAAMMCLYCDKSVGGYETLEGHVVAEHGVKRHQLHCVHEDCKESVVVFDSLQKRRAHYKKEHGWG